MSVKYSNITEYCTFLRGLTYKKTDEVVFSKNAILRSNNVSVITNKLVFDEIKYIDDKILINDSKKVKKGSLLICTANGSKSHLGKVALIENEINFAFGGFMGLIVPNKDLSGKFLYYNLIAPRYKKFIKSLSDGANINNLKFSQFNDFTIPVPSLSEQQTIVEKLDFAFDAIEKAKANIEKNIENAKELFQSKLNEIFSQKGEGWEEKKLSEVFKMKSGVNLTSKMMKPDGEFPVFGGNNIAGYYDNYNFESGVIVGRVGALCGNVRFIDRKIWITDNAFKLTDFMFKLDFAFLTYLLNYKNLREYARQTAQPVISNSSLKDVLLNFPNSVQEQEKIVSHLDSLSEQTNLLKEKYKHKLANLEELKKSILEKAFKGELV